VISRAVRRLEIQTPPDGFTQEESMIARLMYENTIQTVYAKLPTSRMKAIVAMHFELGYTQEMIAEIFAISQERINEEIGNIKKILMGKPFRARREKPQIAIKDLISICMQLQRQ